jgi:hypothetical protein
MALLGGNSGQPGRRIDGSRANSVRRWTSQIFSFFAFVPGARVPTFAFPAPGRLRVGVDQPRVLEFAKAPTST